MTGIIDWTHDRPGVFCPSCGHGLIDDHCAWCGHPDPEAMRARTRRAIEILDGKRVVISADFEITD